MITAYPNQQHQQPNLGQLQPNFDILHYRAPNPWPWPRDRQNPTRILRLAQPLNIRIPHSPVPFVLARRIPPYTIAICSIRLNQCGSFDDLMDQLSQSFHVAAPDEIVGNDFTGYRLVYYLMQPPKLVIRVTGFVWDEFVARPRFVTAVPLFIN